MVICNLLLVADNCYPRKVFSIARHIKTCFRSFMTQSRFNSLAILHCQKEGTDKFDLTAVANEFISKYDIRRSIFRRLYAKDFAYF